MEDSIIVNPAHCSVISTMAHYTLPETAHVYLFSASCTSLPTFQVHNTQNMDMLDYSIYVVDKDAVLMVGS